MSYRLSRFETLKGHAVIGKLYERLNKTELELCLQFITQNDGLDRDAFAFEANRWMLDQAKPKHYSDMWAIVSQVNV